MAMKISSQNSILFSVHYSQPGEATIPKLKTHTKTPSFILVGKNIFYEEEDFEEEAVLNESPMDPVEADNNENLNEIETLLQNSFRERQELKKQNDYDEILRKQIELQGLLTFKEGADTCKNDNNIKSFLDDPDLTSDEKDILIQNYKQQQENFLKFAQRDRLHKVFPVKVVHEGLTNEEILKALEQDSEEDVILKFSQFSYLLDIRRSIALESTIVVEEPDNLTNNGNGCPSIMDDEVDEDIDNKRKKKKKRVRGTRVGPGKKQAESLVDYAKRENPNYIRHRLKLDDALTAKDNFEGWSPARIKAYKLINTNENAYYYRFNSPGEQQKNGAWSSSEKALFMDRLKTLKKENGLTQWGIFSKAIPGRVGYQCSNFYRQLLKHGQIKDEDYYLDEKGQIHCKHGKGSRKRLGDDATPGNNNSALLKQGNGEGKKNKKANGLMNRKRKKGKQEDNDQDCRGSSSSDDDNGDEDYSTRAKRRSSDGLGKLHEDIADMSTEDEMTDESSPTEKRKQRRDQQEQQQHSRASLRNANPLPGFIDQITQEEVYLPTISPYGHVLGYQTWIKILEEEPLNTCPFTKQRLQKTDLVRLTMDNIEKHRARIIQ